MAMQTHSVLSVSLVNSSFISKFVPIFIALMVWVIRILLIGTLSKHGDKLIREAKQQNTGGVSRREYRQAQSRVAHPSSTPVTGLGRAASAQPASRRKSSRPEPTYIPMNDEGAYRTMKASGDHSTLAFREKSLTIPGTHSNISNTFVCSGEVAQW